MENREDANKENEVTQIAKAISGKIVEKIEQQKKTQKAEIESLKKDSEKAKQEFANAIQKLQILYNGQSQKSELLNNNYYEVLKNITVINTKLETLGVEVGNKFDILESSFIKIFENDERVKAALRELVRAINSDRKKIYFLVDKILGKPFSEIGEGEKTLLGRIALLEEGYKRQKKINMALIRRVKRIDSELKTLKVDCENYKQRIQKLENSKITKKIANLLKPFKKGFSELATAIAKSIIAKLLILLIISLGLMPYLDDYIELILDDLF